MNYETKNLVNDRLNEYLETFDISLSPDSFNRLKTDYMALLQVSESLKNTENDKNKFKNEYNYYYNRILKNIYKEQMRKLSEVQIEVDDPAHGYYIGYINDNHQVYSCMRDVITNLDYLIASSTMIVNNAVEDENKIQIDLKDCVLGGDDPNDLLENLEDYYSGRTLRTEYLNNKNEETTMLEDGLEIMDKVDMLNRSNSGIQAHRRLLEEKGRQVLSTKCAIGELQKKAAVIYTLMREEHRSHFFLWRWFKGGESRARLNEFKNRYCEVFGVRKGDATNGMLRLADGNSLLQYNHNKFCENCKEHNFLSDIKDRTKNDDYNEIINTKIKETKDFDKELDEIDLDEEILVTHPQSPFNLKEDSEPIKKVETEFDEEKDIEPFNIIDNELNNINQAENEKHPDWENQLEELNNDEPSF